MKVFDLVKLGHTNVLSQKKRSVTVVVVIGVLFSILFAVMFILQGMENVLLQNASRQSDKIRLTNIVFCENSADASGVCQSRAEAEAIVQKWAAKFNGYLDGGIWVYQDEKGVGSYAIEKKFIEDYLQTKIDTEEDVLPIVASIGWASRWYWFDEGRAKATGNVGEITQMSAGQIEKMQNDLLGQVIKERDSYSIYYDEETESPKVEVIPQNTLYQVVGFSNGGNGSLVIPTRADEINWLNVPLGMISGEAGLNLLIIDDGSDFMQEYLANNLKKYFYIPIASFDKLEDAYEYYSYDACGGGIVTDCRSDNIKISGFMGNQVSVHDAFVRIYKVLNLFQIVLTVVAIIIMVFTFIHLLGQDVATVALYRALGATKLEIYFIYLVYLVELCIFAIIFAVIAALVLSLLVSLLSSDGLYYALANYYGMMPSLVATQPLLLIGLNNHILMLVLTMLFVGAASSLLTIPQLSDANISKRMK